jgi:hypothetical protein
LALEPRALVVARLADLVRPLLEAQAVLFAGLRRQVDDLDAGLSAKRRVKREG